MRQVSNPFEFIVFKYATNGYCTSFVDVDYLATQPHYRIVAVDSYSVLTMGQKERMSFSGWLAVAETIHQKTIPNRLKRRTVDDVFLDASGVVDEQTSSLILRLDHFYNKLKSTRITLRKRQFQIVRRVVLLSLWYNAWKKLAKTYDRLEIFRSALEQRVVVVGSVSKESCSTPIMTQNETPSWLDELSLKYFRSQL